MASIARRFRVFAVSLVFSASGVLVPTAPNVVAPHPLLTQHVGIAHRATQAPPTIAECIALFGITCYQAPAIQKAYNLGPLYRDGFNGAGRTIVIVDSFGSPTIASDLHVFDQAFGLPDPTLQVISPAGTVPFDNTNSDMLGWAYETTLDVEWSHAIAPGAKILLVTTPVSETEGVQGFPEMMYSENYVINHNMGDVISQSFGATEETFPNVQSLLNLRYAFVNAKKHDVTVLGGSGDFGSTDYKLDLTCCYPYQVNSWPSSDPLVTSVGGTQLHLTDAGIRTAPDNVWNDGFAAGGGGPSHVFSRPQFQNSVRDVVGSHRGTPDISMSAACDGAVLIWSTFDSNPNNNGWGPICGTSEASPLFAGVVAIADQMAGHRLGWLNGRLYNLGYEESGVIDVTSGNNTFTFCQSACGTAGEVDVTVPGYSAARGYDMASGIGTLDANRFVRALAESD